MSDGRNMRVVTIKPDYTNWLGWFPNANNLEQTQLKLSEILEATQDLKFFSKLKSFWADDHAIDVFTKLKSQWLTNSLDLSDIRLNIIDSNWGFCLYDIDGWTSILNDEFNRLIWLYDMYFDINKFDISSYRWRIMRDIISIKWKKYLFFYEDPQFFTDKIIEISKILEKSFDDETWQKTELQWMLEYLYNDKRLWQFIGFQRMAFVKADMTDENLFLSVYCTFDSKYYWLIYWELNEASIPRYKLENLVDNDDNNYKIKKTTLLYDLAESWEIFIIDDYTKWIKEWVFTSDFVKLLVEKWYKSAIIIPILSKDVTKIPIWFLFLNSVKSFAFLEKQKAFLENIRQYICSKIYDYLKKEALNKRSWKDPLTWLKNRAEMTNWLITLWKSYRRSYERVNSWSSDSNIETTNWITIWCVMYLDIDHFKRINDTFWHDAWDKALKWFTELVSNILRPWDELYRRGWEEFAIVIPLLITDYNDYISPDTLFNRAYQNAIEIVNRIQKTLKSANIDIWRWESIVLGMSVWVVLFTNWYYYSKSDRMVKRIDHDFKNVDDKYVDIIMRNNIDLIVQIADSLMYLAKIDRDCTVMLLNAMDILAVDWGIIDAGDWYNLSFSWFLDLKPQAQEILCEKTHIDKMSHREYMITFIDNIDCFDWLEHIAKVELVSLFESRIFYEWEIILKEWYQSDSLFIVKSWKIDILKTQETWWFAKLWELDKNSIWWEMSFLNFIDWIVSWAMASMVVRSQEVEILSINKISLKRFIDKYPIILENLRNLAKQRLDSNSLFWVWKIIKDDNLPTNVLLLLQSNYHAFITKFISDLDPIKFPVLIDMSITDFMLFFRTLILDLDNYDNNTILNRLDKINWFLEQLLNYCISTYKDRYFITKVYQLFLKLRSKKSIEWLHEQSEFIKLLGKITTDYDLVKNQLDETTKTRLFNTIWNCHYLLRDKKRWDALMWMIYNNSSDCFIRRIAITNKTMYDLVYKCSESELYLIKLIYWYQDTDYHDIKDFIDSMEQSFYISMDNIYMLFSLIIESKIIEFDLYILDIVNNYDNLINNMKLISDHIKNILENTWKSWEKDLKYIWNVINTFLLTIYLLIYAKKLHKILNFIVEKKYNGKDYDLSEIFNTDFNISLIKIIEDIEIDSDWSLEWEYCAYLRSIIIWKTDIWINFFLKQTPPSINHVLKRLSDLSLNFVKPWFISWFNINKLTRIFKKDEFSI